MIFILLWLIAYKGRAFPLPSDFEYRFLILKRLDECVYFLIHTFHRDIFMPCLMSCVQYYVNRSKIFQVILTCNIFVEMFSDVIFAKI